MRNAVYSASVEPNILIVFGGGFATACGSKIGGSNPPSGVNEARNTCDVIGATGTGGWTFTTRSRGTGELLTGKTPDQFIGTSKLPSLSTASCTFAAVGLQGPIVSK